MLSVCLTFDVDGMSAQIGTIKSNNPSVLSRGEFEVVGTPRVLALLAKKHIHATFFIPGHTACAFPDLVKQIRDAGHEIGHHGWVHENPSAFDRAGEQRNLERGLEALDRVAAVRPAGYRSPANDLSKNSFALLQQFGFMYDSSCMAGDFIPYYVRTGDDWGAEAPYRFGRITDLVELPIHWALDDFVALETYLGLIPGYVEPRAVESMWRDDFDFALEECGGGAFIPVMHPQCIGRGSRIRMLERLIDYMQSKENVEFQTMRDYATAWAAGHPVEAWQEDNPLRCGTGALTSL